MCSVVEYLGIILWDGRPVPFAGSPRWCSVVNSTNSRMKKKKGSGKTMKMQSTSTVRASISFPPDIYESLEELAKKHKVSLAWVVRDAAERYIADRNAEIHGAIEKRLSRKKTTDR
jgi:hypothetical protein